MSFASWWAEKYRSVAEVPKLHFELMQSAYEAGKNDEREACADICDQYGSIEGIAEKCARDIRARSNSKYKP